ncbi:hypothetical protein UFOVP49_136 [uncultured Caudovirales phage]|uniref:Uncharacterized protein n=1 Tax=uncultured Caudovirales phage TaxID=2100421 RepID=A0A6J5KPR2_9CAUD|nr:hypothetical protein UFOVP49_136 [uncultured Caudovirales phage]
MKRFRSFLAEKVEHHVDHFMDYACGHLGIKHPPKIDLIDDKNDAADNKSFGSYCPSDHTIKVNSVGRHPADVLRTLAHELVHHKQNLDGKLNDIEAAGKTGSDHENEANALAGVILRHYGKKNPKIFESRSLKD